MHMPFFCMPGLSAQCGLFGSNIHVAIPIVSIHFPTLILILWVYQYIYTVQEVDTDVLAFAIIMLLFSHHNCPNTPCIYTATNIQTMLLRCFFVAVYICVASRFSFHKQCYIPSVRL